MDWRVPSGKGLPEPLQVARRSVQVPAAFHDWSRLPAHDERFLTPDHHRPRDDAELFGRSGFDRPGGSGLVLAEVGFETPDEMEQTLDLPPWVIREVSDDIRFTGGALASLTANRATELIRQITTPQE